jgi:hypothetical protein
VSSRDAAKAFVACVQQLGDIPRPAETATQPLARSKAPTCSPVWQLIQIAMNWEIDCEEPEGMMDSTTGKMPLSHTWEINSASLLFSYEVEAGQYPR